MEYEIEPPIPPTFELAISLIRAGHYGSLPETLCCQAIYHLMSINSDDATINIAVLYNILAFIFKNQKDNIRSAKCLVLALQHYQKVLGEDNLRVADIYNNLAVMYQKLGVYDEAKSNCLKAAEIMKKILGPSHIDVQEQFDKFSIFYEKTGQCEKTGYQHAVNIYKKVGPVCQSTATKLKVD